MLFKFRKNSLEPLPFYDFSNHSNSKINGTEKDLENLLINYLGELYTENGLLMPIFQERSWQEEPDICALDREGNLVIFELKRHAAQEDAVNQILRYAQKYGRKTYFEVDDMYKKFKGSNVELSTEHKNVFQLDIELSKENFNRKQKMVIVGGASDALLIKTIDYWKSNGLDIDFLPYRFYEISNEIYFEFFAKPYDSHSNPKDRKAVLFDTNQSFDVNSVWDMYDSSKVSAFGNAQKFIKYFNKGDIVLFYHVGYGVIGAGEILDDKTHEVKEIEESYKNIRLLTPKISSSNEIRYISASELSKVLGKTFFYATTMKTPYLSIDEATLIIELLNEKYHNVK